MSACPDRLALFVGLEEDDASVRAHLESCAACRALAEDERALDDAFGRLRDPAPPAELLAGVLARVDEEAALARRARRQTVAILGALALGLAAALALTGPAWVVAEVLEALNAVASLGTALAAVGRALAPAASALALPVFAAEALALVCAALLLNRLVAARVRTS